jgi:hypothetical protein
MLADVMALLVLMCERLQLSGILFVPSHYHLAAKAQKYLRFLEPADQAWFLAVQRAVRGLSLREATRAFSDGRVAERQTSRPVEWRAMQMIVPVSEELQRRVSSEEFDREAELAGGRFQFTLEPQGPPFRRH